MDSDSGWAELIRNLQGRLIRRGLQVADAEDIVQDAVHEYLKKLERGKKIPNRCGWLSCTADRKALEFFKQRRASPFCSTDVEFDVNHWQDTKPAAGFANPQKGFSLDVAAEIRDAVAELPEKHREIITLCDYCNVTPSEAAKELRIKLNTARSRRQRAREDLRDKLAHLNRRKCRPH